MSRPETLAGVPMFRSLDHATVNELDKSCTWRRVSAGEWLIGYQDDDNEVFFVVAGSVRVLIYDKLGSEVILADLKVGEVFGELAPLDSSPRTATVLAISDAVVAVMPGRVFLKILHDHPGAAMFLLKLLAARIRDLDNRVFEFSTLSVQERIDRELLRLARPDPNNARRAIISPPPTHAEIAARVSTHREAVTREMKTLEQEQCLQRTPGAITLLDIPRLTQRRAKGD